MAAPHGKLGPNVSTKRTIGTVQAPSPTLAGAEMTTETYTYIAKPPVGGQLPVLYNGDRQSAQVTLELQTAGPVYVGTKQQILPVTSGKGRQLVTGQPVTFTITKGNRLWVAATSTSRIAVIVEPSAWLELITGTLGTIAAQQRGDK